MDIIIGGGITGLSFAAFHEGDFHLFEKEDSLGGYCRTIHRDGFVWDYSGHFFHFNHDEIRSFVLENMDPQSLRTVDKHTQIYYDGTYVDFPFQKNIHQLPKADFIDCLCDLFEAPGDDLSVNGSFKYMVYNNLGRGISDRFLIPYNEKLYACNLDLLDREAMGRFFPKASIAEIIKNFRNSNNRSYNDTFIYPYGGAECYVKSVASRLLKERIHLLQEVVAIDLPSHKVRLSGGEELQYDRLVSTMPFPRLCELCGWHRPALKSLTSNQVVVFNLGFDGPSIDRNNSWIYIPSKEFIFYRVGYYSNILPNSRMSLYVEIGQPSGSQFNEEELLSRVLEDLYKIGVIENQHLVSHAMVVMDPAYVHINRSSDETVASIKCDLANYGVYSIGRYGSWTYCSIEDNILEAKNLAMKLN